MYYATEPEALVAAEQCKSIIKSRCIWTGEWTQDEPWRATDGLIYWQVSIGDSGKGYYVCVEMWGYDQMYYNWNSPSDGPPEEVVDSCMCARKVDVDGGEMWSFL